MDISGIDSSLVGSSMVQMIQGIKLKVVDAIYQTNTEFGGILGTEMDFSKPSELISRLSQIKNQNSEKFKEIIKDMSDKLKKAASEEAPGSNESKILEQISTKFENTSETGDLSQLLPPKPVFNPGTDQAKIAGYGSTGEDQQTLLNDLLKMLERAEKDGLASKAGVDATGTLSAIQKMISDTLQKITARLGVGATE